jgi:hypothetical protein
MLIIQSKKWAVAFCISVSQIAIAVFAVYSSKQNILSDGACLGGVFGTLANFLILAVAAVASLILVFISLKVRALHPWLKPSVFLCLSSVLAIWVASYAALRCAV